MSASLSVSSNFQFWRQVIDFLAEHSSQIIVWIRREQAEDEYDVVLMFVNQPQQIMVHIYLDLGFFDSAQISRGFQALKQASELRQTSISVADEGYSAPYLYFPWFPHVFEDIVQVAELPTLYPQLPNQLVSALSQITSEVYIKNGPDIPLVICRQYPARGIALKVFVGGL
jgi:hypothetical protein